jgi:hypothetical protein
LKKINFLRTHRFKHENKLHFGDKIGCNFWDFNTSLWLSNGCKQVNEESDLYTTVCKCNHLTNFAALMDMSGRQENDDIKSKLTYFCCGLTIACLIFTILSNFKHKKGDENTEEEEERKQRTLIICNLCVSLMVVNILVITAMDYTKEKVITLICNQDYS